MSILKKNKKTPGLEDENYSEKWLEISFSFWISRDSHMDFFCFLLYSQVTKKFNLDSVEQKKKNHFVRDANPRELKF